MLLVFAGLNDIRIYDLILESAIDGVYYLIIGTYFIPNLFAQFSWESNQVLQQMVDIAEKLNLLITYLPTLADLDRSKDLEILDFGLVNSAHPL